MKLRRLLCGFLSAAILAVQPGAIVMADDTEEEIQSEAEARKQAIYDTAPESNGIEGWPQGPNVYAASAVVMDMDTGAVLYEKKADERHYPASITKLLTVLVALENMELTDTVLFSQASVDFLNYDDAQIGMKPGEELSMEDSLYAVLLASANEVSYAVAESTGIALGGTYETFIEMMNRRSQELGCIGSHWVNPNGLHDDDHYTTAYDMALIASAVYQEEEFRNIMKTLEYRIGFTNLTQEERVFQQNHKMLWPENYYYYEYCTGGKTGYTDQSGTTLVTMAENGGMRLVAVVLQDYGVDAYTDTRAMFDYAFANFSKAAVPVEETSEQIKRFVQDEAYVDLPAGVSFSQLEQQIEQSGSVAADRGIVKYLYQGQLLGKAEVVLDVVHFNKAAAKEEKKAAGTLTDENNKADTSKIVKVLIMVLTVIVLLFFIYFLYVRYRREQMRKRRNARRRAARERKEKEYD